MAKNDPITGTVSYLRKDAHFFADGRWYVSAICPALQAGRKCLTAKVVDAVNGIVDEEVAWADAKTPHHAGLIADQRHVKCAHALDAELMREAAKQEIAAADEQVKGQARNLEHWQARVAELEPLVGANVTERERADLQRRLDEARRQLARHERGMLAAVKRAAQMREHNAVA